MARAERSIPGMRLRAFAYAAIAAMSALCGCVCPYTAAITNHTDAIVLVEYAPPSAGKLRVDRCSSYTVELAPGATWTTARAVPSQRDSESSLRRGVTVIRVRDARSLEAVPRRFELGRSPAFTVSIERASPEDRHSLTIRAIDRDGHETAPVLRTDASGGV